MTIQIVAHDLNMLLPILDGAVYLLDGHPHYASAMPVNSMASRVFARCARVTGWMPNRVPVNPKSTDCSDGHQFTCGRRLSGAETYTLHAKEH